MVRKLFKHEMLAYMRVLLPIYGIVLGIAALGRIVQIFESDNVLYDITNGSALFAFGVAVVVCSCSSGIFSIVRFYKNLFTGEGYLTFTLPITTNQHILVKLGAALLCDLCSLITTLLALCIITAGDVFTEVMKAAAYLIGMIPNDIGLHLAFYVLEIVVMVFLSLAGQHLHIYTCISIGQLFRKNRILAAIGVYYGIYIVMQVLSTVITGVLTVLGEAGAFDALVTFIEQNPFETIHIVLVSAILLGAVLATAEYLLTHYIIRKHLNLE